MRSRTGSPNPPPEWEHESALSIFVACLVAALIACIAAACVSL